MRWLELLQKRGPARGERTSDIDPESFDEVAERAQDLLDAGQEAIRRALTTDSSAFLQAVRQEGGQ